MGDKMKLDESEDEAYIPTDSEDDYDDEERELLDQVKQLKTNKRVEQNRELMRFDDSSDEDEGDDDDDDDDDELMRDSDIEGAGEDDDADMPDAKDWGSKSRNYYHTDFVDQDYSTYNAKEEEMAMQEEEEAKQIQLRLAKHMNEEDFQLDELRSDKDTVTDVSATLEDITSVKADLSGLTKRERQQLFHKQSPEYAGLMADMKNYLTETHELLVPVMDFVRKHEVPLIPGLNFARLYQDMLHTYCCNVAFYLTLKSKGIPIRNHPVIKRLVQLKKIIAQMQEKYDSVVRPQLQELLEVIKSGVEFSLLAPQAQPAAAPKRKSKLRILDQYDDNDVNGKETAKSGKALDSDELSEDEDDEEDADAEEEQHSDEEDAEGLEEDEDTRRGITYQIAKNKGLMPHRKKEQRNPRVKHRSKFRKALIRRKGAVRTVRKETKRYGGEISGIKAGVIKSVKFKS